MTKTTAQAHIDPPTRRQLANAIRALSMDAVQRANSGHPGMPMGMADIAEVLWNNHMRHNPANPRWPDRDRFVLSNGHGSMLLYAVAHLSGYDLSLEELAQFRQLGARTAGHPEYDLDIGIETTTGPLGQGISNAVGMALAEKTLAAQFNRTDFPIVDHYTYVFLGDGCMMEGISHEACSLAGTLGLGKLIALYDDNGISIDGPVAGWFSDNTPQRFEAYGWHVIAEVDGHDPAAIDAAIRAAQAVPDRPSLICCQTVIGWGAPTKQGTEATHGAPLGEEEIARVRETIDWPYAPFEIPAEIAAAWDAAAEGAQREKKWNRLFAEYTEVHPELASEFQRRTAGQLPEDWAEKADGFITELAAEGPKLATRKASLVALNGLGVHLPELIGGSADLTGSNLTLFSASKVLTREQADGNYIYFGVREFAMSAMLNGLALHGGFKPYGATFLTFSDYARNALRMAALMELPCTFVYTHDSIGLGEDGPTHQPIEHLASLRVMPNMQIWRPCDAVETAQAWRAALERSDGPTSLVLTRQSVPHQPRDAAQMAAIARGGYILSEPEEAPELVIIATGSEVGLAVDAAQELKALGRQVRVVSMPCTQLFDSQPQAYRDEVLPPQVKCRMAIEAGVGENWVRYIGRDGVCIAIDRFGESAPADQLFEHFGFTVANVVARASELLKQ